MSGTLSCGTETAVPMHRSLSVRVDGRQRSAEKNETKTQKPKEKSPGRPHVRCHFSTEHMLTITRRGFSDNVVARAGFTCPDRGESARSSRVPPCQSDEKTGTDADRLLVAACEAVVVCGLKIPTEAVLAVGPEHEISCYLTCEGV